MKKEGNQQEYGNGAFVVEKIEGKQLNTSKNQESGKKTPLMDIKDKSDNHSINDKVSYKVMLDIDNYKNAHYILKSKPEYMTADSYEIILDSRWKEKIYKIIEKLKDRSFQFTPSNIIHITKDNGKIRAFGVPTYWDKLVLEVFRAALENKVEKIFNNSSHGFRPGKNSHTALKRVTSWTGVRWIIQGHFISFFDSIDLHILANLLSFYIDSNLLGLYWKMVKAGYIEDSTEKKEETLTGILQGLRPKAYGLLTPLLSNIYLHELDEYLTRHCLVGLRPR